MLQHTVQALGMQPAAAGGLPKALPLPSSLLARLRARHGVGGRQGSRASISVPERSELRAAGSQDGGAQPPPPPPPPLPLPSGPELLRQHLTPQQCEQVTNEILRTFLAVDSRSSSSNGGRRPRGQARTPRADSSSASDASGGRRAGPDAASSGGGRGSSGSSTSSGGEAAAGAAEAPARRRGLQGRVAEHLLAGGFDESLLEPVPTHTLNWVIKVRPCRAAVPAGACYGIAVACCAAASSTATAPRALYPRRPHALIGSTCAGPAGAVVPLSPTCPLRR